MNFGKRIQELRKQNNVTQEDLAAELGVTAAAVSKWENNYTLPDIMMLCALADYFNVTTDELLCRYASRKRAILLADDLPLGEKMKVIVKGYGFEPCAVFTDKEEALAAAEKDPGIKYLVVGTCKNGYFDDTSLVKIVSANASDDEILAGLKWALENCMDDYPKLF